MAGFDRVDPFLAGRYVKKAMERMGRKPEELASIGIPRADGTVKFEISNWGGLWTSKYMLSPSSAGLILKYKPNYIFESQNILLSCSSDPGRPVLGSGEDAGYETKDDITIPFDAGHSDTGAKYKDIDSHVPDTRKFVDVGQIVVDIKEDIGTDTGPTCTPVQPYVVKSAEWPDENIVSKDGRFVITDKKISPNTAQNYLKLLPEEEKNVLNAFGLFKSPWMSRLFILDAEKHKNACPGEVFDKNKIRSCSHGKGDVIFLVPPDDISSFSLYSTPEIERTFLGLLNYEQRRAVASPAWLLDRGLKLFAGHYTRILNKKKLHPLIHQKAVKLAEMTLKVGESKVVYGLEQSIAVTIESIGKKISLQITSFSGASTKVDMPDGRYVFVSKNLGGGSLIVYAAQKGNEVTVKLYERCYIKSYSCSDSLNGIPHFTKTGYETYPAIVDSVDGPLPIGEPIKEVLYPEPPVPSQPPESDKYDMLGLAFWQKLRNEKGDAAVVKMVQAMHAFTGKNQSAPAEFPFLDTYADIADISKEEAKNNLQLVHGGYLMGGVCH